MTTSHFSTNLKKTSLPFSDFRLTVKVTDWPTVGFVFEAVIVVVVVIDVVLTFTVTMPDEAPYELSPANSA
jgi:hypothetical protein